MIRFNYHQSAYERLRDGLTGSVSPERVRLPVALLGAALLAVAGTWFLELQRVAVLERNLALQQARARATASDGARAQRLTADVERLRAIGDRIAAAKRDVLLAANTIATIGNELPPQTWLTTVGSTPDGTWTIGGRSTRVDEIGTMLRRVQGLDRNASARLVSIVATGRAGRILDFVIGWDHRR